MSNVTYFCCFFIVDSLPSGIHVGRSNIKSVAERRQPEIRKFLESLFNSAAEIAHSDLVYTFFHPLLRDQQEYSASNIHLTKVKEKGELVIRLHLFLNHSFD